MSDGNGTPAGEKPEEPQGASEHLNIKVTDNNNEVFFKIKRCVRMDRTCNPQSMDLRADLSRARSTVLKKLMDAFCERQGKSPQSVRFLFDGQRVNSTDTPDTVGTA